MELFEALFGRRSVRNFENKTVDRKLLEESLNAGIWAPTAGNIQPWIFFCITSEKTVTKIRAVSPGMLGNPQAIICVCSDLKKAVERAGPSGKLLALMDCSMAAQNIMLRAYELGLGTCVIRSFNPGAVRELLGAPSSIQPELLITVGYPKEVPKPPGRYRGVIFWNEYKKEERGD
jgi:nitroreductase